MPLEVDPLVVDFLPEPLVGGRLGMTIAPGRRAVGILAEYSRNLDVDLKRLRNELGVGLLVSLVEDHELTTLGIADLPHRCVSRGLTALRFPIPDGGVPSSVAAVDEAVARIFAELGRESAVVVHCRAGRGRTGTLAACVLVARGHKPESAIAHVRAARLGAIETGLQEAWVTTYARHLRP